MGIIQQRVVTYPELSTLFDSSWIKAQHMRRVLAPAKGWRPRVFGTEFDQHQSWGLGCAIRHDGFIIAADTGMGKTKMALDAIDFWMMERGAKHALVITGNPTSTYEWMEQGEKYGRFAVTDVRGTTDQRRAALMHFPETPILATDYKTLQHTFAAKQKVGRKSKFVPDVDKLVAWGRMFDIIVLDELHHVKNPATLCHQIIAALVTEIKYRLGLTGTPFDRHPEHAWAQFNVIDRGATFGSHHDFLGYFFEAKQSFWSMYQVDYKLRKERKEDFRRRVRHRLIRITKAEAPNMPDVQRAIVNLKPSPGTWELMQEARARVKDAWARKEQHSEFSYLRQLCSGLIRKATEDGTSITLRAASSTKIDWLLAKLEELPDEEQLVVFYEFRESGAWVHEALTAAKEKVSWLYGGMGGQEMIVLEAWLKKRTRVLLTQTQKAAESLNLQQAAYLVQYESPVTYAQEKQSLARVGGRIGGRASIVYTLTVKNSQELKILDLIRQGKHTMQDLLE
jgi:hypothetical protein